mmetsp:Transcript_30302/g.54956  ORF Transcript_30302/g.54956 Transcript_30302/m.54956 type:complete len:198 (+) Transcript_30302:103-696(+)
MKVSLMFLAMVCHCVYGSAALKTRGGGQAPACPSEKTPIDTGCDDLPADADCATYYTKINTGKHVKCGKSGTQCVATGPVCQEPEYILGGLLTWTACSQFCQGKGVNVVIPGSADEVAHIKGLLPAQGTGQHRAWIGIEKIGGAGSWKPTPSWTNWKPGGEGNQRESNAGIIWDSGWNGYWYDMNPGSRTHYCVCKQ